MLDSLIGFFLTDPRRLTPLGSALTRVGGFLLVAGLVGRVATTAVSAVHGLAGARSLESSLTDVLPVSFWIPDSAPGFSLAVLTLVLGLWAVRAGRAYERQLGL